MILWEILWEFLCLWNRPRGPIENSGIEYQTLIAPPWWTLMDPALLSLWCKANVVSGIPKYTNGFWMPGIMCDPLERPEISGGCSFKFHHFQPFGKREVGTFLHWVFVICCCFWLCTCLCFTLCFTLLSKCDPFTVAKNMKKHSCNETCKGRTSTITCFLCGELFYTKCFSVDSAIQINW